MRIVLSAAAVMMLAGVALAGEWPRVTLTPILDSQEPIRSANGAIDRLDVDNARDDAALRLIVFANRDVFLKDVKLGDASSYNSWATVRITGGMMAPWDYRGLLNDQGLRTALPSQDQTASFWSVRQDGSAYLETPYTSDAAPDHVRYGYFVGAPGDFRLAVAKDDPLPFIGDGAFLARLDGPGWYGSGSSDAPRLVRVVADGPGVDAATSIWHCFIDRGGLSPLWQENGWLPGLPEGTTVRGSSDTPYVNNSGQILANLTLTRNGVSERAAVLIENGRAQVLIAESSDPSGDSVPTFRLNWMTRSLTQGGRWAITAQMSVPQTAPRLYDSSIWTGVGTSRRLVVRAGQAVTGINGVSTIESVALPKIADDGSIVFNAQVVTPTNWSQSDPSIWIWRDGTLRMLVKDYSTPPGLSTDYWVRSATASRTSDGRVLVLGSILRFGRPLGEANIGAWLTDEYDNLQPIVLPGDWVQVGNNARQIKTIILGTDAGETGQSLIAYVSFFDGASGVYLVNLERTPSASPADINSDGFIDGYDLNDFLRGFTGEWNRPDQTVDIDGDDEVTFMDFDTFVTAFEQDGVN